METNKIRLGEIATYVNGYAFKPKDRGNVGLPIVRIQDLTGNARDVGFYNGEYPKKIEINNGDILISWSASLGVYVWNKGKALLNQHIFRVVFDKGEIDKSFFVYAVRQKLKEMGTKTHGATMKHIVKKDFDAIEIPYPQINRQIEIARNMDKISSVIEKKERQLKLLDDLIQARFVELFGDLKSNNKRWPIVGFKECADIDTNMIHNFEGYENYPHIGINCIEKETGRLIGYRTIAEDGVISGKYLFTPKHIIYSKIRPNLNKVALPDFKGLCSADAYPILVKSEICNREYFGYTLRSKYFLDYILAFSNRTNLPKVNKNQVEGFMLPLPPIDLQNQFAAFVQQVNKSKFVIHKFLYCFIDNKQSIIKPRLNTKESGKIRGGKPHADEF